MNDKLINIVLAVVVVGLLGWMIFKNSGSSSNTAPVEAANTAGGTVFDFDGTDIKVIENRDANGNLLEAGQMQNGNKTGVWTTYYTEGRVKTIESYVGGKRHGLHLELNNRGQVELESFYNEGNLNGKYTMYKSGSRILEERNYLNGKLHGLFRKYDDRRGKIQQEINYKNGVQHGKLKYFDDEGNVTMEYEYKDGEKVSGGIVEKPATATQ